MATTGSGKTPLYPINSVDNALRLLLMFGDRRTIRVSEVSAELNVVRSTAHRLLAMLQLRGLAERDPATKTYHAGPALISLGLSVVRDIDIRALVRPHLQRLSDKLSETVHVMVLEDDGVLFIDGIEAERPLRVSPRIGVKVAAYGTAGGRAMLAELPADQLSEIFPTPPKGGPRSRKGLTEELAEIHRAGFAVVEGDGEAGITSVAAALRVTSTQVRGALAVSIPSSRLDPVRLGEVTELVARAAQEASADLR